PFPFLLAHPLPVETTKTFRPGGLPPEEGVKPASTPAFRWQDFAIEPKWDGIRVQIVRRRQVSLWSRGEEEISAAFPELVIAAEALPVGTTVDGELLAWLPERAGDSGAVAPFAELQRRLNRKTASARLQAKVPVRVLVFDLLEAGGKDLRDQPWECRRSQLESVLAHLTGPEKRCLQAAPVLAAETGTDAARLRDQVAGEGAEGLMLKRRDSRYAGGRPRGLWWKWKIDPRSFDGVLLYAQAGHGRRAGLHTDLTLAVWQGDTLVPVAKAYSGLSDADFRQLDQWIRQHTLERFGPVRRVPPAQVFEIAYEGIRRSGRHKAGLALRFPRIVRWRQDKTPAQADTLEHLQSVLVDTQSSAPPGSARP
ncbi:MAG: cisplatin damage response ATP-dependent DNA ligase, partial [Oceanococcaceae bacterium]